MTVSKFIADLPVDDIASARDFYAGFLGLTTTEFDLGWVARFTDPGSGECIQVMTRDRSAPVDPVASVKVPDVDAAYAEARRRGLRIVHPLSDEEWGVRRFFVEDPAGNVLNIVADH